MSYEAMSIIGIVLFGTLVGRFIMSGIIEHSISRLIKSVSRLIKSVFSIMLNRLDNICDTIYKSFIRKI